MLVSINNPILQTWIFSAIFFVVLLLATRRRKITEWFPTSLTAELKGLAILMIVISHIGYFLVTDHRFLWPLSIAAGVGVNLFLFLSGFGLAASQMQKNLTPGQFYKKRLLKIFTPFWLMLVVFVALDFFILKINYSWEFLGKAAVGIFTRADLYHDLNSPLWYLTFIIGYYLLFPLVFFKKCPWLSAIILYAAGYLLVFWSPAFLNNVLHLYKVHLIAFPLGVLVAWAITKLKNPEILERLSRGWRAIGYYLVLVGLLALFIYTNTHSGINSADASARKEELMSILGILAIVLVFIMKKREFRMLSLFGIYSYEIYLWHWPIMYRYDIFYSWLPAWLSTILYLGLFLGVGWAANRAVGLLSRPKKVVVIGEGKK